MGANPVDSSGYHSARNSNDFGGFWDQLSDSNSIFVAADFFFERFEFLVCSKFNHTQRGRTCACAVACLYPHNSISNVVASVTIHDDICIQILYIDTFERLCKCKCICICMDGEASLKRAASFSLSSLSLSLSVFVSLSPYLCVSCAVVVVVAVEGRGGGELERPIESFGC